MTTTRASSYPTKAKIMAQIEIARQAGIAVAGYEVGPAGTIRILSPSAFSAAPADDFDAWDKAGRL